MRAVELVNKTGRTKVVSYRALGSAGFRRDFTVVSGQDHAAPRLVSFRRSPAAVDVRTSDQTVTVRARVRSAGAGVRWVYASFSGHGSGGLEVTLALVSGTRHDGVWRGVAAVHQCPARSGSWHGEVRMLDRARNFSRYSSSRLQSLGSEAGLLHVTARPDALPPEARYRFEVPAGHPPVLRFSEAVNGITAVSATVRRAIPESGGPPGPLLDGVWRCRDAAAARTNCSTGHVLVARFWPTAPFEAERFYAVELNPEHSLEVTDLAGNPFDRDSSEFLTSSN